MAEGTINLYSDTQTRPTEGMRRAIAEAEVGDEQRIADPTVTALQKRVGYVGMLGNRRRGSLGHTGETSCRGHSDTKRRSLPVPAWRSTAPT